jgi:pSer/pThr/pTyr-binding forkhead associated (FHA) protein
MSAVHQPSPIVPSQQNGIRNAEIPVPANETQAVLALIPLNGTFERKQINVPFQPGILKVGRQTNAKTVPTQVNGYFDSKVLSRAHAEVWADRNSKIWIRDVKSSNGTFVNGQRLSPENRDSEPHELREHDTLELGIDIVSEDQKSIVHHKVSAKVEFAGIPGTANNVLDLNFGDIDPSQGGGLLSSPLSQPMAHARGRPIAPYNRSASSSISAGSQMGALGQQRQMNMWGMPLSVEHLVKVLSVSHTMRKS